MFDPATLSISLHWFLRPCVIMAAEIESETTCTNWASSLPNAFPIVFVIRAAVSVDGLRLDSQHYQKSVIRRHYLAIAISQRWVDFSSVVKDRGLREVIARFTSSTRKLGFAVRTGGVTGSNCPIVTRGQQDHASFKPAGVMNRSSCLLEEVVAASYRTLQISQRVKP